MNELLVFNTETQTVSARSLHDALEATERFSVWIQRYLPSFVEGIDYTSVSKLTVVNNGAERSLEDYQCSIEMAKHICLMSRTEAGKRCRQYLIDLEKAWSTPELVMARGLQAAQKMILQKDEQIKLLTADNERMKPKEVFADAVTASESAILIRELAKIIKQNGQPMGEKRLYKWLRENGYIIKGTCQPTQRAMELGLFETIERTVQRADMPPIATLTTKVTGKGQQYFINKLLGDSINESV